MAIKNKQPMCSNYLALWVLDEVLQPLNSKLIGCPAIVTDGNSSVAWDVLLVPGREVVLAGKDDKWWDSSASNLDSLDHCKLLAIARLNSLWSASSLWPCYNKLSCNLAHHKASFGKVVDILIEDAVLGHCLLYKLKPTSN
jgi:hypothetical protein